MSLKNDLMSRGYVEIGTRGKCKYYVKDGEKYAVAIAVYKEIEYPLIVENDVFRELGYPSIWVCKKNEKMFVPSIQSGIGCKKRIHNLILPVKEGMDVDHINHCRSFCTESNLRYCTPEANGWNSARAVRMRNSVRGYRFKLLLQSNVRHAIPELKKHGFSIMDTGTWFSVESPDFLSKVDCYLAYRDSAKVLYQGTGMERFVYDIRNDFSETFNLLLDHYIFHDITENKMLQMNLDYWRDTLDNAPIAIAV